MFLQQLNDHSENDLGL